MRVGLPSDTLEYASDEEREREFAEWLKAGKLPEVKSGVQQRSVRTAYALVESGFQLLRVRSFDALSIEEICSGAGATVGAFYGRFDDKKSFFIVLQRVTCLRSEKALAEFVQQTLARKVRFEQLCERMVALTVQRYRMNVGIYRAALQQADDGAWELFRQLGDTYKRALTEILSPYLPHLSPREGAMRIQFAHQVMMGTLVHAMLNDPGPVHLHDQAMISELTGIIFRHLRSR